MLKDSAWHCTHNPMGSCGRPLPLDQSTHILFMFSCARGSVTISRWNQTLRGCSCVGTKQPYTFPVPQKCWAVTMLSIYCDILQLLDLLIIPRIPRQQDSETWQRAPSILVSGPDLKHSSSQLLVLCSHSSLQRATEIYKAFIQIAKYMPSFLLGYPTLESVSMQTYIFHWIAG